MPNEGGAYSKKSYALRKPLFEWKEINVGWVISHINMVIIL